MIDSAIESRLAAELTAEASTIPAGAAERLTRIDYRPRRSRVSGRRLGAAGGAAGLAAATVAAVLFTGATPAFAGWTSTPAKATPAQLADANFYCSPELDVYGSGWTAVTSDVRGPYTLVVYQDAAQDTATCLNGPSLVQVSIVGGSNQQTIRSASNFGTQPTLQTTTENVNGSSGLDTYTGNQYEAGDPGAYDLADGQVDPDVTAVTLNLSDGTSVGTTIGGGWMVAWWPGDASATSATVTTPNGTTTVPLGS
jgi:hypothetical protein